MKCVETRKNEKMEVWRFSKAVYFVNNVKQQQQQQKHINNPSLHVVSFTWASCWSAGLCWASWPRCRPCCFRWGPLFSGRCCCPTRWPARSPGSAGASPPGTETAGPAGGRRRKHQIKVKQKSSEWEGRKREGGALKVKLRNKKLKGNSGRWSLEDKTG